MKKLAVHNRNVATKVLFYFAQIIIDFRGEAIQIVFRSTSIESFLNTRETSIC